MRIGLIIFSRTGNTYSVAEKLKEKLAEAGHDVELERITIEETAGKPEVEAGNVRFTAIPDAGKYDAVVFGGPVQGYSMSPVMNAYFSHVGSLKDKKVAFLITHFFPFACMGGNRAAGQMVEACRSKDASICGSGIVNWTGPNREKQIKDIVEKLSSLF